QLQQRRLRKNLQSVFVKVSCSSLRPSLSGERHYSGCCNIAVHADPSCLHTCRSFHGRLPPPFRFLKCVLTAQYPDSCCPCAVRSTCPRRLTPMSCCLPCSTAPCCARFRLSGS